MSIVIESRAPKARKVTRSDEFATEQDAERYVRTLPQEHAVTWTGNPDRPAGAQAPQRAMWSSAITWGLVNVPVKAYAATETTAPPLKQVCIEHGSEVGHHLYCKAGGESLESSGVSRGIAMGRGVLPLTSAEIADLPKAEKAIRVQEFVPVGSIPEVNRERPYWIGVDLKVGRRGYDLLAATLRETGTVAICEWGLRERMHLVALEAQGDRLVLWQLHRAEAIRSNDELPGMSGDAEVNPVELAAAVELVRSMRAERFSAERYPDTYGDALKALALRHVHDEVQAAPQGERVIVDMMASLQASVDEAKSKRERGVRRSA